MSLMLDDLVITFTDETHEEVCFLPSCDKVALWTFTWQHVETALCDKGHTYERNYCDGCKNSYLVDIGRGIPVYCGKCEDMSSNNAYLKLIHCRPLRA